MRKHWERPIFILPPTSIELAKLYSNQRRYPEAETYFQQALTIQEQSLGPFHPDVATTLENYAALLYKIGQETKAAQMEIRTLGI